MKTNFKKTIKYLDPRNVDNLESINPYRDWKVAVIFSAILMVVVLSADGYVLWKSLHVVDENIILEEPTQTFSINRVSLDKAIEAIKAKEEQFRKPFNMIVPDPSL